ncbi:MAG: SPOR domain-containing protein [Sulfurovum sp.]|nr:MAG: SPOR domain-containing protein [Sulfurovum sp.]
MNDHNLDDLIIDNIEPKNSKTKSFLTIIALLIVVLIVAIILTKIILKDPNAEKLAFEENNTELISPELTLQSAAEPKAKKEETKLSNIIEHEPKAPVQVEEVAKETIEITKEVVQVLKQPEVKTKVENSIKEVVKTEIPEKKEVLEKVEPKKVEPKKEEIKKELPKVVKPLPTKIIEKAKERPTGRPVNVPATTKPVTAQAYYIQVGSFTQTPSARFLSIIKNSGFNYKITSPTSSGTKKLLIGPYKNRASADTALVRVKDRINKSAFVVKK